MSMMLHLPDILTPEEVQTIREGMDRLPFQDGRLTAGGAAAQVKQNLQAESGNDVDRLGQIVFGALVRTPHFTESFFPKKIRPPLFSRYEPGMTYGEHVDRAIMGDPGTPSMIRTDLSITVFLNDPESYDGGELVINTLSGEINVKLPPGHAFVYPSTTLHRVEPVTRGRRDCAVTWVESYIRADPERQILREMTLLCDRMHELDLDTTARNLALLVNSKLRRMWWDT